MDRHWRDDSFFILLFFAKPVTIFLLGPKYIESIILVRWMAFIPFMVGLSNVFGIQTMLTFGMQKQFSRILILSGIFNLILLIPLISLTGVEGAAISLISTELVVTLSMAIYLKTKNLRIY
jgi:O-antigen/teichoic acid export membrane protein